MQMGERVAEQVVVHLDRIEGSLDGPAKPQSGPSGDVRVTGSTQRPTEQGYLTHQG